MSQQTNFWRNTISLILVALFGFSALFNLFNRQDVVLEVANNKIKYKDLIDVGGQGDKQKLDMALYLVMRALSTDQLAIDFGLYATELEIQNEIKNIFQNEHGFDNSALESYLKNSRFTKNGLIRMIRAQLLEKQIFGLPMREFKIQEPFLRAFITGMTAQKSGYVLTVPMSNITPALVLNYIKPTSEQLSQYLLTNGSDLANQRVYVIYAKTQAELEALIIKTDNDLKTIQNTYKVIESEIQDSGISVSIKNNQKFETKLTKDSKVIQSIGQVKGESTYFMVHYDPMLGLDPAEIQREWASQQVPKQQVAELLFKQILAQTQKNNNLQKVIDKLNLKYTYKPLSQASFTDLFHKAPNSEDNELEATRKKFSDCMCLSCFRANNKLKLNYEEAVVFMTNSGSLQGVCGDFGIILANTNFNNPNIANIDQDLSEILRTHIVEELMYLSLSTTLQNSIY